jgi:uroporphyrinogen-III decarboxylase
LLPSGTPEQIKTECKRLCKAFSGAGYIFASSQVLNRDVPTENIAAMYEAAGEASNSAYCA